MHVYKWYEARSQTEPEMKSLILKRSVVLRGHKTSISVEDAFWSSIKEIAGSGQMSVSDLLSAIDSERHQKFAHFLELARIVGGNHETAREPPMCAL